VRGWKKIVRGWKIISILSLTLAPNLCERMEKNCERMEKNSILSLELAPKL
jgi:hypothetical protein